MDEPQLQDIPVPAHALRNKIALSDNLNATDIVSKQFGTGESDSTRYMNDATAENFVTSMEKFTVKEVEILEVRDKTALPTSLYDFVNRCLFEEMDGKISGAIIKDAIHCDAPEFGYPWELGSEQLCLQRKMNLERAEGNRRRMLLIVLGTRTGSTH
jgi:hypothetical protein